MCWKQGPILRELCLHFQLRTFRKGTDLKYRQSTVLDKSGHGCGSLMKSKLTESQHIDICKPINLVNKKLGDKNPPRTIQLNKKMNKEEIGNTVKLTIITRRQVKGEEGGKILLEIWPSWCRGREGRITGKIPRYTYLTLTPPYNLIG